MQGCSLSSKKKQWKCLLSLSPKKMLWLFLGWKGHDICRYPVNCLNGHSSEKHLSEGRSPEWTQYQIHTIPNKHSIKWTRFHIDTILSAFCSELCTFEILLFGIMCRVCFAIFRVPYQ